MNYFAYHFTVVPPQPGSEILTALISDLGFESFVTTENGFTAYIQDSNHSKPNLSDLKFEDFKFDFHIEKIEGVNWNAEWEKNFEPIIIGNLLCIRAPFHSKSSTTKYDIEIMPKMSFGTGHHQTTQLICERLFELNLSSKRVLDMGCGTGVLAILAKKLGASEVLGVDIDEWCVENSMENCEANGYKDIKIIKGDVGVIEQENMFNIILANINKNILKTHLENYSRKMIAGGFLLMSGFFKTDVEELKLFAAQNAFLFLDFRTKDEWAMITLQKN